MSGKIIIWLLIAFASVAFIGKPMMLLVYPNYFPVPVYSFINNGLTQEKIDLGRMLFYDPILSKEQTISCADCHSPYNAFAHTDHALSHGIGDSIGIRNAPALFNLAWQKKFMWDGAIHNLDMLALAPLTHPGEMGENLLNVVEKLQKTSRYRKAFYIAWGDSVVTGHKLLKAIAQFQLTLVSATSKYDNVKVAKQVFSTQEKAGYVLFQNNCNTCHTEPLFSSYGFANNGLPKDTTLNDLGKYGFTKNETDRLKFKIPSLRNLSYTYPYMHDGRFDMLHEVLNHYTHLKPGDSPEPELQTALSLTSKDKADLIAFLFTLNDKAFVFDSKNKYPRELLSEINNQ
ncbi:MAG: cytochrome c peroxidase [Dokdonia sp.]|jgi:cytochrome c peroxidase